MVLNNGFRAALLVVILLANPRDHYTVFGQSSGNLDLCLTMELKNCSFGLFWKNMSDFGVNCSISDTNIPTNMSCNPTSSQNDPVTDVGNPTDLIDTGFVSKDTYQSVITFITFIFIPSFTVLGLIGNILSLRTLVNQKPRNAIKVYLICLSITDILVLLLSAIVSVNKIIGKYNPTLAAKMTAIRFLPVDAFAYMVVTRATAFLTIVLSLERTIAVKLPFIVQEIFLNRHPWKLVALMYLCLTAFFFVNLFCYDVLIVEKGPFDEAFVVVTPSKFARPFFTSYGMVVQIITRIIPMFIVLLCNLVTVISLRTSARFRKEIVAGPSEDYKVTRLLLAISAIFLACIIPGSVNYIVAKLVPTYGFYARDHYLYSAINGIDGSLIVINSGVNFIIYMFFSQNFRKAFFKTWGFAHYLQNHIKGISSLTPPTESLDTNTSRGC